MLGLRRTASALAARLGYPRAPWTALAAWRAGIGKPRTFIIVTGAGRSGTSAVARVLHKSGLRMGRRFTPPTEFNALGYYEELPVMLLNDRIVTECGMDQWGYWPSRAQVLEVAAKHAAEMDALASHCTSAGWKDPRFCITLEAWLPRLPAKPKVIVCLRNPQALVESALRHYGVSDVAEARSASEATWEHWYGRLLEFIRDFELEATSVDYDELLDRPEEAVAALSRFVGCRLSPKYLQRQLRHHSGSVPERYAQLYDAVKSLGRPTGAASG